MVVEQKNRLYTPEEAAEFLHRVTPAMLERWRRTGVGPRFVKLGRKIAYRLGDLEAWLEQQTRQHTGEPQREQRQTLEPAPTA